MTNRDIQKLATRYAAEQARNGKWLDPEDAWHLWSYEHDVHSPAAQHVFETCYQAQLATMRKRAHAA